MEKSKQQFTNKLLDGQKGKLMLQIAKSFKGDSRFQLDRRFEQDVDIQKLPQKFKQTLQKDLVQRVQEKTKQIKKEQPTLIVRRFQPGTVKAEKIVRKAEGRKQFVQSVIKSQKKKMSKKGKIHKGIDKIAKANQILNANLQQNRVQQKHKFQIVVKGNRQEAFQAGSFKLFQ